MNIQSVRECDPNKFNKSLAPHYVRFMLNDTEILLQNSIFLYNFHSSLDWIISKIFIRQFRMIFFTFFFQYERKSIESFILIISIDF